MSEDKQQHGAAYKAVSFGLGVASVAAIVMSFIPEVNLLGAVLQGAITLVQTGMDLASGNKKKAALDFGIGALLTAASVIPFLGAAGNLARGLTVSADSLKLAETASAAGKVAKEAEVGGSLFARMGRGIKGAWQATKDFIGKAVHWVTELPGIKWVKDKGVLPLVNKAKTQEVNAAKWATGMDGGAGTFRKPAMWLSEHAGMKGAMGMELGANAAGIGLGFVNDSPPGNLANPDSAMYASNKDSSNDSADAKWQNAEKRRREERALAAANGASV